MNASFYQWFLRELIEALLAMDLQPEVGDAVVLSPSGTRQALTTGSGVVSTRGQSTSSPRPRQNVVIAPVGPRTVLLGDGKRFTPPLMPLSPPGAYPTITPPEIDGWVPPPPPMPPLAPASSVAGDGAQHAAHAYTLANDGLWDAGFPRETGAGWCPPLPPGSTPVEPTGVFSNPTQRRCLADNKARPEHLGTGDRFNLRLPVMQGIDSTGPYLRVVRLNMKTFEYR